MACLRLFIGLIHLTCATCLGADFIERPLPQRSGQQGTLFRSRTPEQSGIRLVHRFPETAPLVFLQEQAAGCGVAVGDMDGDGLPDLLFGNYDQGVKLYKNLGDWKFQDVTAGSGIRTHGMWSTGASIADIDNDGDLDLYLCVFNKPNLLFLNQGDGTFLEQAGKFGLDWTGASMMALFLDYDRDGRLDMFLLTHRDGTRAGQGLPRDSRSAAGRGIVRLDRNGRPEISPDYLELFSLLDKGQGRIELAIAGQEDQLFRQETNGHYTRVTKQAGLHGNDIGLGASVWDYNSDTWPDIYVANDHKTPDRLWRNNRDGTFTEVATEVLSTVPMASMGTDVADVNNDGHQDLLATEMAGSTHERRMVIHQDFGKNAGFFLNSKPTQQPRNTLHLGTGGEATLETARIAGLDATDWTWSPKFGDFDNDGRIDLFIANGMSRDFVHSDLLQRMSEPGAPNWRTLPALKERNLAFQNLGDLRFERTETRWGLDQITASFGAAVADFDVDGDLDLVVMNLDSPPGLYINQESSGHRLVVRLKGTRSNSWGIGASVIVETANGVQTRVLQPASGFISANEPLLHFGLGTNDHVRRLVVRWPMSGEQVLENIRANSHLIITEPSGEKPPSVGISPFKPWFGAPQALDNRNVTEISATARDGSEIPSPWQLGPEGATLAVGDLNGDGLEDLFVGGTQESQGRFVFQERGSRFRSGRILDEIGEEVQAARGAHFFEADGDGDLDLLLLSGDQPTNVQGRVGRDRLYLNDGKGGFIKASEEAIPAGSTPGSVACAADFDRDGDLDLFVGGGISRATGKTGTLGRVLQNTGGRFADVTEAAAPEIIREGWVTGAVWVDLNNDGWIDLALACSWGDVEIFLNSSGRLHSSSQADGQQKMHGFWQGIAAADVDRDGDIDLITSNLGSNTQIKAPSSFWCGDLASDGRFQWIDGWFDHGKWRPSLNRKSLDRILPHLPQIFPTHSSFASATLPELLEEPARSRTMPRVIDSLDSAIWINDGRGHFRFAPLPGAAQLAPAFAVVAGDLNGDGFQDLAMMQNLRSSSAEDSPMNGGLGLVVQGGANQSWTPLPPQKSGLRLQGEWRAAALIDINADAAPDMVVARKDGSLHWLANQAESKHRRLRINLQGSAGNPTAVGARLELQFGDGSKHIHEFSSSGGWISHTTGQLFIAVPGNAAGARLQVRWPDGTISTETIPDGSQVMKVQQPGKVAR